MANEATANRPANARAEEVRSSLFSRLLRAVFSLFFFLVLGLFISIIIEWIVMAFVLDEASSTHSKAMYLAEATYLNGNLKQTLFVSDAVQLGERIEAWITKWVIDLLGFQSASDHFSRISNQVDTESLGFIDSVGVSVLEYLKAAINITKLYAIRLTILVLSLPIFVSTTVWAIVEGLNRRDLRRWGGGRESSFVYHWAKKSLWPLFVAPFILYLAMPISMNPTYVILPCVLFFGTSVLVTVSSFKKYL